MSNVLPGALGSCPPVAVWQEKKSLFLLGREIIHFALMVTSLVLQHPLPTAKAAAKQLLFWGGLVPVIPLWHWESLLV